MTASSLPAALGACAAGIYTHEAGVSLLIANRTFPGRDDFTSRFIARDTAAGMAAIDWAAAITALATCSPPYATHPAKGLTRCIKRTNL